MTRRTGFLTLLLPCLVYLIFWRIGPLLYTVFLSFNRFDFVKMTEPRWIGLSNYFRLAKSDVFYNSLKVTASFTVVTTCMELLLGLCIALFLNTKRLQRSKWLAGLVLAPMFLTPPIIGTLWYIMFHGRLGPINYFLSLFGVSEISWLTSFDTAFFSLVIADLWHWTPFVYLILYSALQTIDKEMYEASEIDGASSFQRFRYIILPFLGYPIFVAVVLRSMDAFREFAKVFVMTGGGPGQSTEFITLLDKKIAFAHYCLGYASSLVIVILVLFSATYAYPIKRIQVD